MIKQEVRGFYLQLMGKAASELKMVDKLVMEKGPRLSYQQQQLLNADCQEWEVNKALFNMDPNKVPGIDGFNIFFL